MDLQTIIAQGPDMPLTIADQKVRDVANYHLNNELDEPVLSPESGIQKIRKVLARFSIEIPALYDSDPEGIIDLEENYHLYFIYYLTEDDFYEFYAEIVNDEELDEIISDEEEDEEE